MTKRYTAQDMRKVAKSFLSSEVNLDFDKRDIAAMLRQSADILDGVLNEITIIEKMPTAALDGAFENQKVNGERLMAKISFYDKVREIVGEVSHV